MRMRQETFKKSYYIPAFGKSIEIRRNQDIDENGILGKELLAQYGEDCILEGETKSLMEKVASGDIGGSSTSLTTEQTAAIEKIEGLQASASEIDVSVLKVKLKNSVSNKLFDMPVSSKGTITSPTTYSTTGFTYVTPVANGWEYSITADTTADSSVLTNVSSTVGLVVGQLLYQSQSSGSLISDTVPLGSRIVSIDSATQITISKPCLLTSTAKSILLSNKNIKYIGGITGGFSNTLLIASSTVTSAAPRQYGNGYAIEFMTDAANFSTATPSIIFQSYRNGIVPNSYKVAIDDVYQSEVPQAFLAADSGVIQIQFATSGIHKVRIEIAGNRLMQKLYVMSRAKIWMPTNNNQVKACVFGDSWMANGETTYDNWSMANIANRFCDALGWEIFNSSVGGTGYSNNGVTNFNWQSAERLDNTTLDDFDAIVVFGSVNDASRTTAEMKSAALVVWQGIRLRNPNVPMFIFGVPTTIVTSAAVCTILENGLKEAFAEWNDSNSFYFPITNDPKGAWLDSDNTSIYIGADGTHPNATGVKYISTKMADCIKSVLN